MLLTFPPIIPKPKLTRTHFFKILNAMAQFYMGPERQHLGDNSRDLKPLHHGAALVCKNPQMLFPATSPLPHKVTALFIPILQMKKPRFREVKYFPKMAHRAGGRSRI